jgi:TPR repeat protein
MDDLKKVLELYYHKEDYEKAFPLIKKIAEENDPNAQFILALMYKDGRGIHADEKAYKYWLSRFVDCAEAGNPKAQWELSCHYRWADHFPLDIGKANYWLEQAANNGNADAQYHLALYFQHAEYDYEEDADKARYWFMKAVEQDYPEALYVYCLEFFENEKPTPKAVELLKKAAEGGCPPAKELLAKFIH